MPEQPPLYIGLMSGTSIDSIDAILADFSGNTPKVIAHHESAMPAAVRDDILKLSTPGDDHVDLLGRCDTALGKLFAQASNDLLNSANVAAKAIIAIGSHGQTIRHRPPQKNENHPFSLQIGDPNIIASKTRITTVADFRRRDLALGGQGAPLVPAFHRDAFHSSNSDRAIVNIGGIANITWIPSSGNAYGFDTGPGNMLMDAWAQKHLRQPFDNDGNWAASGDLSTELLNHLLKHPFLAKSAPKSTGREEFNIQWLNSIINHTAQDISANDVQATLLEFTARSVADSLKKLSNCDKEVYICGGGAFNRRLMDRLQKLMGDHQLASTDKLGIDPKHVEGLAFAWLAMRTMKKLSGNLPGTTGASRETILGGVYFA